MGPRSSIDGLDCSVPSESYVSKLRAGGVDCMHLSVEDMDGRGGVHPFVFVTNDLISSTARCDWHEPSATYTPASMTAK